MACGILYKQLREIERALNVLRPRLNLPGISDAYNVLYKERGALLARIGFKFPRTILQLVKLIGLSPGTVTLWHDVEGGWMTEARAKDGAPPVYHYVKDDVAVTILSGELTHELEAILMKPDDYLGE